MILSSRTHTRFALSLCLIVACGRRPVAQLSEGESALGREVGIPDSTMRVIKEVTGAELTALVPLDSLGQPLPPRGIGFGVSAGDLAATSVSLRARLGPGFIVFRSEQGFGRHPDSVGIIASADPLDILRIRATNGTNYDIFNDSIIALVRHWHDALGFRLDGAGFDWLEGSFPSGNPNFDSLAVVVNAVCPDVVTQGTETVDALASEMRKSGTLYCWWD
jgi:hypothetical protein